MTRNELERELRRKKAIRTQHRLRWVHGKGYSYKGLSDISGSPIQTIRNLITGRTNRTRDEELIEWTNILFEGVKDGSIPAKPTEKITCRQPVTGSHKKRAKNPRIYTYPFATDLLSERQVAEYSRIIERILIFGTSYNWIAEQIGSDHTVIMRLHHQIYFDIPDECLSLLHQLLEQVENEETVPPISRHRPRLDPRIFAKCHKQLLQLLKHFSKADLLKKIGVEYNVLQNFLHGKNERFPYPARVEKLWNLVTANSMQSSDKGSHSNIYNISA